MPGFDRNEFWIKILSMYPLAKESGYLLKLNEEQISELKAIYINTFISEEQLKHLDEKTLIKKMMIAIVSIYKMEKDTLAHYGEIVELVNSVKYDGRNLYIYFAKVSPVKLRRIELGKSIKQIAEKIGCNSSTVKNCEEFQCDLRRQPESLVIKLAHALECDVESLY